MADEIKPALTPGEWAKREIDRPGSAIVWVGNQEFTNGLALYIAEASATHSTEHLHAIAALALHGQPFGFTHEDVEDELLAYRDTVYLARRWQDLGDEGRRQECIARAARHRYRADKIRALLPPADVPRNAG